jgi:hypothetical protein
MVGGKCSVMRTAGTGREPRVSLCINVVKETLTVVGRKSTLAYSDLENICKLDVSVKMCSAAKESNV